jgi:hypothetical protein
VVEEGRELVKEAKGLKYTGPCVLPQLVARTEDQIGPRFRRPSVDRRHPSSVGRGMPASAPSCLPQRHLSRAYEEGIVRMLTIIQASLLGSALMLLESCSYLTSCELSGGCPFGPNRER